MSQANSGLGVKAADDKPVMITLASRSDLPQRVRHLLEGILGLCSSGLERTLLLTLDEFESQLFRLAEQGRTNEQQYRSFDTLREIKRGRADVTPRYMIAIEDALARFDQTKATEAAAAKARPGTQPVRQELSLVDTRDLEESLALQEFAAKTDIRQAQILYTLGHRFAVLAGRPIFDAETLPIGPSHLGRILQFSTAGLDIVGESRVLLYRTFDRMVQSAITALYESVNTYLTEQHILPHLKVQMPHAKTGAGSKDQGTAAAGGADAAQPEAPAAPEQAAPGYAPPGGHAPQGGFGPAVPMPPGPPLRGAAARPPNMPSWAPDPYGHAAPADERDSELFTTLRELLAGRRHALGLADAPMAGSYRPSGEDVQSVLGALQSKPISPMTLGGKVVQRSVAHLKQDLLAHLRQLAPDGKAPQLAPEDSDTIDLVGMLFDYITKNTRPNGNTQSLLTKLQVPLLRVALKDKSFFTRRAHPARQMLNAIAETGSHWIDDTEGPADRALIDKMQIVVDRVTQEFDGNLGLMENMLADLSQHMHTLARKAEVTERRHVDAAKGREKLEVAREQARTAIAERVAAAKPGKLVRTLLEQAWTDVLALTLLRQGENSEIYKKRLGVAEQLLAVSKDIRTGDNQLSPLLRSEIETGLDQVGYHKDDIQAVVKRLFLPEAAANESEPASSTEIALKLKSKARLGDDSGASAPAAAAKAEKTEKSEKMKPLAPDSAEAKMMEKLKTLPFGTWFEFRTNQQGDKVRRKLAWFSTLTGRCLFVNQRGVRTDEKSLEQLARDVVSGQANIVEPEQESIVDRAWKAIMTGLKNLIGGGGPDPLPVPA